jgi:hypothetical protein
MCVGIVGNDLVVRVAADEFHDVTRRRYVRPMDFTGKPMKGFIYVSPPGFRTRSALREWLECGQRFVRAADAPKGRRKSREKRFAAGKT